MKVQKEMQMFEYCEEIYGIFETKRNMYLYTEWRRNERVGDI